MKTGQSFLFFFLYHSWTKAQRCRCKLRLGYIVCWCKRVGKTWKITLYTVISSFCVDSHILDYATCIKGSVVNKFFFLFVDSRTLGYAEAVYDYAATATSQLSLCRGDRVAILSKTGSDKGWWKGEHCGTGKVCHLFALYNNLFHIMYSWTCLVWHQFNQLYCVIWHWISNSIFFFSGGGGIHCKFQHPVFIF